MFTVKSVENTAGRLDELPIARAATEFSWATAALWMVCQLANVQCNTLYQCASSSDVLQCNVVCDCFEISDGWFSPDYLSHLDRRFSACA